MSVTFIVDDSAVQRELRRLEDGPGFDIFQEFASVVQLQYIEARLDVHQLTGSLYLSAKWDATQHDNQFEGEVSFGGAAPGAVNDPVNYAKQEQDRGTRRTPYGAPARSFDGERSPNQGNHDFMRGLPALEHGYVEAILNFFRG